MKLWLFLAGGVLLIVACAGAWYAVHDPRFWSAVFAAVVAAAMPVVLKRKSLEQEARDHQDVRQRTERDARGRERMR